MTKALGRLKEVDIRTLWGHEQYDFSSWLAKEENIHLLNDVVGLNLIDIDREVYVGSYRCDLVALDEATGIKVIIENQLESTNHDHLGKIITYASGLDADVVVWIVKEAREEHKSAIEWLNNKMAKNISFFLIEIHAYQIGDSLPAPKFEIIEEPNDFLNSIKNYKGDELSKIESDRLHFWTEFNAYITERGKPFNPKKVNTNQWYSVALGTKAAHSNIYLVNQLNHICVDIYIPDDKALFDGLYKKREEIEEKLGFSMDWERLDHKKAARIKSYIPGLDFNNKDNYPELMKATLERVMVLKDTFQPYILNV